VRGQIYTRGDRTAGSNVSLYHRGAFSALQIVTRNVATYNGGGSRPGDIVLNGNWNNGGEPPTGDLVVETLIDTQGGHPGSGATSTGNITVQGYRAVTISNVTTRCGLGTTRNAGNLTIQNVAGPITLAGQIYLKNVDNTNNNGRVLLQTTYADGGKIYVGASTNHVLDCSLIRYVSFDCYRGRNYIVGELRIPGSTAEAKRNSISNYLRGNRDQVVFYDPKVQANSWLDAKIYLLGSNGDGQGELRPLAAVGTIVILQ
jgi:hypothetical protein